MLKRNKTKTKTKLHKGMATQNLNVLPTFNVLLTSIDEFSCVDIVATILNDDIF